MGKAIKPFWRDFRVLFIILYVLVSKIGLSEGTQTRTFQWDVAYMFWSPDCIENVVMGINGQFPGPTIKANVGDTIVVHVTNKLFTEGVVIHWHGIRQIGTPWADGTASISQCAINPGETFNYTFKVDKVGTYFYHGHYGMQRMAGLYGSLIVDVAEGEKELFHYDEELNLLLSDWWHQSVHELEVGLSSSPTRWINDPQNHNMTVVEADGNYVEPFTTSSIDIYSGESYSVLITTNQDPTKNYWLSAAVIGQESGTPPALTLLNYLPTPSTNLPISPPPPPPLWNDITRLKNFAKQISATATSPKPPQTSTRRILLLNTQNLINGAEKWALNNVSLSLPTTPYLGAIKLGLNQSFDQTNPPETFPSDYDINVPPENSATTVSNAIYRLELGSTVDIVLQNANTLTKNFSEIHPWHLHGHDFWVLGYGEGKFSESTDEQKLNLKNPPLKNTVAIFPYGWTAVRFVADNPGVWVFHCHIEPHLHLGMGIILAEGVHKVGDIPKNALSCGLTGERLMADKLP